MPVLYLIGAIVACGFYSIILDYVSSRNKEGKNFSFLFNLIICATACTCWCVVSIFSHDFDPRIIPYALAFGFCVGSSFLFTQLALKDGNVSIVTLIVQFGLVVTAIYGLIFWKQELTAVKIIGLCLVCISLVLMILKKEKADRKKNVVWLIFAFISMAATAGCSIVQKQQTIDFSGTCAPLFMVIATSFASLLSGVLTLVKRKEIQTVTFKKQWYLVVIVGFCNFCLNVFVFLLANTSLSPTLIYPALSLSIILVIIYAAFIKKEKTTLQQWIGIAIGITALVLLSF